MVASRLPFSAQRASPVDDGSPYTLPLPADAVLSAGMATITGWTIRWGDGVIGSFPGTDAAETHSYTAPAGMYSVAIEAIGTDADGHIQTIDLPHEDLLVPPDAPAGLSATETQASQVDVSWNNNTPGALRYVLTFTPTTGEAATYIVGPGGLSVSHDDRVGTLTTTIDGLIADMSYNVTIAVVGQTADGTIITSSNSSGVSASPPAGVICAATPATVDESDRPVLSVSSDVSAGVDSWQATWYDADGHVMAVDTFRGAGGVITGPAATTAGMEVWVSARDGAGTVFKLPVDYLDTIPLPPTDIQVVSNLPGEADVTWNNTSTVANGFDIYRADDGGAFQKVATVGGKTLNYSDTSVTPGTSVQYEVNAIGPSAIDASTSDLSSTVTVSVSPPASPLLDLSVTSLYGYQHDIELLWHYNDADISGFEIEQRDRTLGENFHLIATPGATHAGSQTLALTSLVPADEYDFRIRADLNEVASRYVQTSFDWQPIQGLGVYGTPDCDSYTGADGGYLLQRLSN